VNVQDLCDLLLERYAEELAAVQTGESSSVPIPAAALTAEFLADNIADVFKTLSRKDSSEGELIGFLEINAFLAAFQRAYEHQHQSRVQRWAQIYNHKKTLTLNQRALKKQMRNIGVKVDDEFLTEVVLVKA